MFNRLSSELMTLMVRSSNPSIMTCSLMNLLDVLFSWDCELSPPHLVAPTLTYLD